MSTQAENIATLSEKIDHALKDVFQMDLSDYQRKKILELKEAIEAFHKEALWNLVKTVRTTEEGKRLMLEAVEDPAVYAMLLLHGIIKQDMYTKVAAVLEEIRPYLRSHGGDIELDRVEENVVYVQLQGACSGCSLSAMTLKNGVEEAIKTRLPEVEQVMMTNDVSPGFMPLNSRVDEDELVDSGWKEGPNLDDIEDYRPYYITLEGVDVLLAIIDNKIMAYRNRCPHRGIPFTQEKIIEEEGMYLIGQDDTIRFDLSSGECITVPHIQLEPFPVRLQKKQIWIRTDY